MTTPRVYTFETVVLKPGNHIKTEREYILLSDHKEVVGHLGADISGFKDALTRKESVISAAREAIERRDATIKAQALAIEKLKNQRNHYAVLGECVYAIEGADAEITAILQEAK